MPASPPGPLSFQERGTPGLWSAVEMIRPRFFVAMFYRVTASIPGAKLSRCRSTIVSPLTVPSTSS